MGQKVLQENNLAIIGRVSYAFARGKIIQYLVALDIGKAITKLTK